MNHLPLLPLLPLLQALATAEREGKNTAAKDVTAAASAGSNL
ncbi:hypothetical protein [Fictibacillus sp. NRS-1165]